MSDGHYPRQTIRYGDGPSGEPIRFDTLPTFRILPAESKQWELLGRAVAAEQSPLHVMARATGPLGSLTFTAERPGVAWEIHAVDTDVRIRLGIPLAMSRGDTLTMAPESLRAE